MCFKTFLVSGNIRAASLSTLVEWVVDAWQELSPEIIVKSFKKCCISNKLDGSEDDILWEEEKGDDEPAEEPATDVYDDAIHPDEWLQLFGEPDDFDSDEVESSDED